MLSTAPTGLLASRFQSRTVPPRVVSASRWPAGENATPDRTVGVPVAAGLGSVVSTFGPPGAVRDHTTVASVAMDAPASRVPSPLNAIESILGGLPRSTGGSGSGADTTGR